jgi:hypothetical protein
MDLANHSAGGKPRVRSVLMASLMRFTRPFIPLIGFMIAAWAILFLVTDLYLIPALQMAQAADPIARRQLAAISALVLAIILTCLVAILLLLLRPGRFFLPRKSEAPTRTRYSDAWAEAGQRIEVPKDEQEEES